MAKKETKEKSYNIKVPSKRQLCWIKQLGYLKMCHIMT